MREAPHGEQDGANAQFRRQALGDVVVWIALIGLAAASLAAAFTLPQPFNLAVGLAVAAMQIALLGLFFMQLRRARALIMLTAGSAFLFVAIMFAFTLNDLFTRV